MKPNVKFLKTVLMPVPLPPSPEEAATALFRCLFHSPLPQRRPLLLCSDTCSTSPCPSGGHSCSDLMSVLLPPASVEAAPALLRCLFYFPLPQWRPLLLCSDVCSTSSCPSGGRSCSVPMSVLLPPAPVEAAPALFRCLFYFPLPQWRPLLLCSDVCSTSPCPSGGRFCSIPMSVLLPPAPVEAAPVLFRCLFHFLLPQWRPLLFCSDACSTSPCPSGGRSCSVPMSVQLPPAPVEVAPALFRCLFNSPPAPVEAAPVLFRCLFHFPLPQWRPLLLCSDVCSTPPCPSGGRSCSVPMSVQLPPAPVEAAPVLFRCLFHSPLPQWRPLLLCSDVCSTPPCPSGGRSCSVPMSVQLPPAPVEVAPALFRCLFNSPLPQWRSLLLCSDVCSTLPLPQWRSLLLL